jgi:hypothetical protein
MKFNIVIYTQVHENYGAHDWDGKGACPQYWKAKGGDEYRHPIALDPNEAQDRAKVNLFVKELTDAVSRNDNFYQETVLDWEFLPVGELTSGEKEQMEWYGSVKYPAKAPRSLEAAYAV